MVSRLMEHCDTVQIIGTWYDSHAKESHVFHAGEGNWYARVGVMMKFLERGEGAEPLDAAQDEE